jgi:hypothetical protein
LAEIAEKMIITSTQVYTVKVKKSVCAKTEDCSEAERIFGALQKIQF